MTPVLRLYSVLKQYPKNEVGIEPLPFDVLKAFEDFFPQENSMLFTALKVNGEFELSLTTQ